MEPKVLWRGQPPLGGQIVRREDGVCEIQTPGGLVGELGRVVFFDAVTVTGDDARNRRLSVRFTDEEYSAIEARAYQADVSISEYSRAVLINQSDSE